MSPSIEDVAKLAGVSKATVSRYLNGVPGAMRSDTAKRIANAIEQLGYRPNIVARSLKKKRTQTIGLIVANILNPFSAKITKGIEDLCRSRGYSLMLCNAGDDSSKQQEYMELLYSKQVDGLIIQPAYGGDDFLKKFKQERGCPIVVIDRRVEGGLFHSVVLNNETCTKDAVEYLISLGHRRIGVFTSPIKGVSSRQERLQGYINALSNHGIEINQQYIKEFIPNTEENFEAVKEMLSLPGPPSAIIALNGWITLEVISAIKTLKMKIPEDLSFIGFDDEIWVQVFEPPLTVVSQPTYEMGYKSAEILLELLTKPKKIHKEPLCIQFHGKLIKRQSCTRYEIIEN